MLRVEVKSGSILSLEASSFLHVPDAGWSLCCWLLLVSQAFLGSPPPSESAVYLLVHECHFGLLEGLGYGGFNSGEAARATLRVSILSS